MPSASQRRENLPILRANSCRDRSFPVAYLQDSRDGKGYPQSRLLCLHLGVARMLKEKRERRERTDNYHLLQQWCRTPEQRLEENPLLGEWRMYAALKQLGISVSPRTCGRIMAENRRLYAIKPQPGEPHKPKPHPFKATARHERWCLDIRYMEKHRIPEIKGSFYVITVMDAFSRAILSSDIFQSQDLVCVLIVLYAAVERFGAPRYLITDNGGVFRAKHLLAICEALGIEKEYIHPRQSWENLVETHFNVMRRMSQVHFEQVTSWQGAKIAHERFVTDYNAQPHWAYRKRDDNRLSPAEVLGQETSKLRTPEQLHRIFYATRHLRRLDRLGYAHFRRWKLYGEETLARHPAVIWLHGDTLTVEYEETPLTQYTVRYQPDKKHFKAIPDARRFETPYRSPQEWLWELDETLWHLAKRLPDYAPRKHRKKGRYTQLPLLGEV